MNDAFSRCKSCELPSLIVRQHCLTFERAEPVVSNYELTSRKKPISKNASVNQDFLKIRIDLKHALKRARAPFALNDQLKSSSAGVKRKARRGIQRPLGLKGQMYLRLTVLYSCSRPKGSHTIPLLGLRGTSHLLSVRK